MKLQHLLEAKEKNLIGLMISDGTRDFEGLGKKIKITPKTKDKIWSGDFYCGNRELTSLEGAPKIITKKFSCDNNDLISLKHGPEKVGEFSCNHNELTSLEEAPAIIGSNVACEGNHITSLKDIHKIIKKMDGVFWAKYNPIESHVLGVLYIDGCLRFWFGNNREDGKTSPACNIINKYLPNRWGHKGVFECQCALQDAGFDDLAQL